MSETNISKPFDSFSLCGVLLSTAIDLLTTDLCDFLEIESLDQSEELILWCLKLIINKSIGEKNWVVCPLDLIDGLLYSNLELLLSLNSISNTFPQLLKWWWIDEQEVTLQSLFINLSSSLDINLNDWDLSILFDSLKLGVRSSIPTSVVPLSILNEGAILTHFVKFFLGNKDEVLLWLLIIT